jgi:hypothetical protein
VFPSSQYALPILKQILKGEMPAIPAECGSQMQDLIPRCWSMKPTKRPTFEQILDEFKTAKFRIVPAADEVKLGAYVADIEKWEKDDALQSHRQ